MVSERVGITICAMLAYLAVAQGAAAQAGAREPLFGPGSDNTRALRKNRLDLTLGLHGGYDDSVAIEKLEATDPRLRLGAYYGSAEAGLDFSRQGRRVNFAANGTASLQQFENRDALSGLGGPAGGGSGFFGVRMAPHTQVGFKLDFSSSPFFGFDSIVGQGLDTPSSVLPGDRAVVRRRTNTGASTVTLTHDFTDRSTIEMDYGLQVIDLAESPLGESYHSLAHNAGLQYRRELTANTALLLGYAYNQAPISLVSQTYLGTSHNVTAGIDYRRPFRLAERTTFEFGLGSNVVSRRDSSAVDDRTDGVGGTVLGVLAHAQVNHRFSDTWGSFALYDRGVEYSQAFAEPVFSDSVSVALEGSLTRRIQSVTSASYSNGGVGFSARNEFDTLGVTSQLVLGLTRHLALSAEYHYYRYQIGDDVLLVPGFSRNVGRRGVRVGLTAWLPLFGR